MKKSKKIGLSLNKKIISQFKSTSIKGGLTGISALPGIQCGGGGGGGGFTQGNRCQQSEELIGGCNDN
ncbi:hypothetical protein [Croceivirga thetidis]|uniref:Bacteriocin n=1 Tax=Croceivirga thetidis TaxID=2721623 RepID=A0ABX1GME5_9FLAO|nr:hypothetical protein [Croceivirga thetidis]NKI30794.1 hypothetical protein [Croceivirga thetidis]